MTVYKISDTKYATGPRNERATAVVSVDKKGNVTGVRGQRPVLDSRYKSVAGNAKIRETPKQLAG